jgi:hypothetical protein
MANVIQILRSAVFGNRPAVNAQPYGVPYVNFAGKQFGVVDSTGTPQDLIGVTIFSPTANYTQGQPVNYQGQLYTAKASITAGAWNPAQWSSISSGPYLPLIGGTLTGELSINYSAPILLLNATAAGQLRAVVGATNSLNRWAMSFGNSTAETGSNAGSDFSIDRYNDAGTYINSAMSITRSSGNVTVAANLTVSASLTVSGDITSGGLVHSIGYQCRLGTSGPNGGDTFNFNWTGSALDAWIDTTRIGSVNITSDYRFKKDVKDAPSSLDQVMQWRPITYTGKKWNIFEENENVRHSFIAHELQDISPDCVVGEKDGEHPQSLDLIPIVVRLTKAVQELSAKVTELEARLAQ